MKKINILLISATALTMVGCGGGSGGGSGGGTTVASKTDGFSSVSSSTYTNAANATPIQGSVIQSNINDVPDLNLSIETTKDTVTFKQIASKQDVSFGPDDNPSTRDNETYSKDFIMTPREYKRDVGDGNLFVTHDTITYDDAEHYLSLGGWTYLPNDPTKVEKEELGLFVTGSDPFTQANIAGLTGVATYEGAVGMDSIERQRNIIGDVEGIAIQSKNLLLTANFNTNKISGSANNFYTENATLNAELPTGLRLELQEISINPLKEGGFGTGNTLITHTDNTHQYKGKWGAQFYGNGTTATDQPKVVAGTFGATAVKSSDATGSFVGAFIAKKQ